jgi:uncharacterized protein (DUF1697 family)
LGNAAMTVFAALLRAVNVAGSGILKMADLKAVCEKIGFTDVQTLLQSGNVVFTAAGTDKAVAKNLAEAIDKAHGFRPAVAVRTAAEIADAMKRNPFTAEAKADPRFVVVGFFAGPPAAGAAARIATVRGESGERLSLSRHELFVHYPEGQGRSKVTNAVLERALGVPVTVRNWNTVTKLNAMLDGMP